LGPEYVRIANPVGFLTGNSVCNIISRLKHKSGLSIVGFDYTLAISHCQILDIKLQYHSFEPKLVLLFHLH
jgi:hypothetical protein